MNSRAPKMWDIITSRVDFEGKSVIDLGCGTGDFLWRSKKAGARQVVGIDVDMDTCWTAKQNCAKEGYAPVILTDDICLLENREEPFDVALCLSVIPYVANLPNLMVWMRDNATVSLVECPYSGDGPGPKNIKDDEDMAKILSIFWDNVEPIGTTDMGPRPGTRTIWLVS